MPTLTARASFVTGSGLGRAIFAASICLIPCAFSLHAQVSTASHGTPLGMLAGTVVDPLGKPASSASVVVRPQDGAAAESRVTDSSGQFSFSALMPGPYSLSVAKPGSDATTETLVISAGTTRQLRIVLGSGTEPSSAASGNSPSSAPPEFSDKPNFSVAGVTDWTAVGGHGSDAVLRTSESITRDTVTLKSPASGSGGAQDIHRSDSVMEARLRAACIAAPGNYEAHRDLGAFYLQAGQYQQAVPPLQTAANLNHGNPEDEYQLALAEDGKKDLEAARDHVQRALAQKDAARYHRLAGRIDEQLGDPLAAVQQQEFATQLDPSEENYFDLGSELLLHRAIWQAAQTFAAGAGAYPTSSRMNTGWGAALFASARYKEAASRLCEASDLNPADIKPYQFLGRITVVSPTQEPCVSEKLERFLSQHPSDPEANYFLALLFSRTGNDIDLERSQTLLRRAIALDPGYADAHLQLGSMLFDQQKYEDAIAEYSRAIKANRKLADAHYRLAVAYDRVGKHELAQEEFVLHKQLQETEAEKTEQERRELKQFVIAPKEQSTYPLQR